MISRDIFRMMKGMISMMICKIHSRMICSQMKMRNERVGQFPPFSTYFLELFSGWFPALFQVEPDERGESWSVSCLLDPTEFQVPLQSRLWTLPSYPVHFIALWTTVSTTVHTWYLSPAPHAVQVSHFSAWCQNIKNLFLMFFGIRNTDLAWFVVSNCWAENGAGVNKMTNITYATVEFNICIWSNVKQVFFCVCNYSSNKLSVQLNICPGLTFVLVLLLNWSSWTGYLLKL